MGQIISDSSRLCPILNYGHIMYQYYSGHLFHGYNSKSVTAAVDAATSRVI